MSLKERLHDYILSSPKINTHCHHMGHVFFDEIGLEDIFGSSYIAWCHEGFKTYETRKKLFDHIADRSYFIWLERSLRQIYGIKDSLNADTWDQFDACVRQADKADRSFSRLRTLCNYEHIVEDCYWNYGDNLGDPELFTPTFRINIFLNGYDWNYIDRDGCCVSKFIPQKCDDIDVYVQKLEEVIEKKHQDGCVALKCATAYERGLDFYPVSKERAEIALQKEPSELTEENVADFQSYIFYKLCEIAAKEDIPFQIHTGLGQLENTRAINLTRTIKDHPDTKFVLFHLSFPYFDDVISLAHNHPNVYPDICWVPLLSYNLAADAINRLLDTVNADKLCWGCDTWTVEESYGAILAIAHSLSTALTKRVQEGFMSEERAFEICHRIMYANAKALYFANDLPPTWNASSK